MTNYNEAVAFHAAAEANFDAACASYKQAAADFKRSKSRKNAEAFLKAQDNHEAAANVMSNAQVAMERAATVDRRKAVVAGRVAQRAAQGSFF